MSDRTIRGPIGIIGGSGLDDPRFLSDASEITVETPYGVPSSSLKRGVIDRREVVLLSRHGRQHTIPPSQVNNRANIHALKQQGCTAVLATAACGSLCERMGRGNVVIPDQFIDFTRHRAVTFHESFEPGIQNARHTPMADPFDPSLRTALVGAGRSMGISIHDAGTILTIEGPRFSTRAESRMFQMWGADLVNMTVAPEVILANELAMPYAVIAVVTDFDCWKTDEPPLRVDDLVAVFTQNVELVTRLILNVLPNISL